jgi:hypothetical protein
MKKVVFVGGTSYSGSTFLAMTLANDPRGLAVGEPRNFLNPTRPHHRDLLCSCGDRECAYWQEIKKNGAEHLYETVFSLSPETEFIVDSSKDPFWTRSQSERLALRGIRTKNLLIWKTPLELAYSFLKRGQLDAWEKAWVTYHRLFFSLVDDWRAIEYSAYVQDAAVLERTCDYLEIPFFPEKTDFWNTDHHVIGGNHSAKIHLYAEGSSGFQASLSRASDGVADALKETHRSVYYHQVSDDSLRAHVEERIQSSELIQEILQVLRDHHVLAASPPALLSSSMHLSGLAVGLREIKRAVGFGIGRLRYGDR